MKVLVVEDDIENARHLIRVLSESGHVGDVAGDAASAVGLAKAERYDVIVLDRMLPDLDGISVVKKLRRDGNATPVLFLTNVSGMDDRVEGLEAGGDDYLVKPFAAPELLARLAALARRPDLARTTALAVHDLELDLLSRTARRGGEVIDLQPREFKILECLIRNDGRIVTRKMLLETVWEFVFDPQTSIVETHISRLRAKVDREREPALIQTVRGVGYCLRAPS